MFARRTNVLCCLLAALSTSAALAAAPLGTAITYQGRLQDGGLPVNGLIDLRFQVFDALIGGGSVTGTVTIPNVQATNGLFTVEVDFGVAVLNGDDRFLRVEAAVPAGGAFQPLTPRQRLAAAPYALQTRGMFVDNALNAGLGTTSPNAKLDIEGELHVDRAGVRSFRVGSNGGPEGLVANWENTTTGATTAALGNSQLPDSTGFLQLANRQGTTIAQLWADSDATNDADARGQFLIRSLGGGPGGEISVRNDSDAETIELLGGAAALPGALTLRNPANAAQVAVIQGTSQGGRLASFNEVGQVHCVIEPDVSGAGAFMQLARLDAATGLQFDGNSVGSGNPILSLFGTVSTATFNANASGDAAVVLTTDAISPTEMFAEPGVANIHTGNAGVAIGTSHAALTSRTITCPDDGFVLVMAQGDLSIGHLTGTPTNIRYGVSTTAASLPINQDIQTAIAAGLPTGTYDFGASAHGLFAVTAGANTFFFVADEITGDGTSTMFDIQLTLIYFPTSYGTTVSNLTSGSSVPADNDHAQVRPALTDAEIEAEQRAAAEFHEQKLGAELQQMRAAMQTLQARLDEVEQAQAARRVIRPEPDHDEPAPLLNPAGVAPADLPAPADEAVAADRVVDADPQDGR